MSKYFAWFLVIGWLLSACTFSLADDVKPPPGYQPQPVVEQTASVHDSLYPLVPPDPAAGKEVFLEKCSPCHGETGLGDGERAKDLPNPVTAIGLSEVARSASPVSWFNLVTQGNPQKSMPPFTSLTDRQRWDVVVYAFLLSESQQDFADGRRIYQENCSACHGDDGRGIQKPAISDQVPDFTNLEFMAGKSTAEFFSSINAGVSPAMPPFAEKLTEKERWTVASYIRAFSLASTAVADIVATQNPGLPYPPAETRITNKPPKGEPAQSTVYPGVSTGFGATKPISSTAVISPSLGIISGTVTNGSGGSIPVGAVVTLHAFDLMQLVITTTTQVNQDGTYTFDSISFSPDRSFFTTLDYAQVTYSSELQTVKPGQDAFQLPIQVFDATTHIGVLVADRVHFFIDPSDQNALQIVELFIISNNSSNTLVAEQSQPVVEYQLPPDAFDLMFQDGQLGGKYIKTDTGFGDITPIRPGSGSHQILFSYQLPYDRKSDLAIQMPMDANAIIVLIPENGLKVGGADLQDAGVRDVEGTRYHMYSGAALELGESLNLSITGRPNSASSDRALFSDNNLVIGLGVLGLVLIAAGFWFFGLERKNSRQVELEAKPVAQGYDNPDTVMDAILTLDDLYQDGQLPEEAYLQRRGELKALLHELLSKHD